MTPFRFIRVRDYLKGLGKMKIQYKVFVAPVIIMLCVLFPKVIFAEQGDNSLNNALNNDIGAVKGEDDQERDAVPIRNKPYNHEIDRLHRVMGENARDLHQWREEWYKRKQAKFDNADDRMGYQNNNAIRKISILGKRSAKDTTDDTWKVKAIDAPTYFTNFNSRAIAVDSNNNPHIVYGGDHLYYAHYDGSIWNYETIDSSSEVGMDASIALDGAGNVHISYYNMNDKYLKYVTNKGGIWKFETVDNDFLAGWFTSIAADASGNAHISYFDDTNGDLKYATNATGSWVATTVDSNMWVGEYTSIAVDGAGKVHIRYFDDEKSNLKYASNATGSWVTTTVDNEGDVGEWTSIAVNEKGKVFISYYDASNKDLKYATNEVAPQCNPETVVLHPAKLELKKKQSGDVTITLMGENECMVEGVVVSSKLVGRNKKYLTVEPKSVMTDETGKATFTITAKKRAGRARVQFIVGDVGFSIPVTIKK